MATDTQSPVSETEADVTADPDRQFRVPLGLYHGMIEHGLLTGRDKAVLLDGLLVKTMTRGAPHVRVTIRTSRALSALMPPGWDVRKEDPISLPGGPDGFDSEPEPDVSVVRGGVDDFADHHPGPADVALVVEVADRSLRDDREALARYARAGVPTAWIVNLAAGTVEVYSAPSAKAGYQESAVYRGNESVAVVLDGREVGRVAVADLLP